MIQQHSTHQISPEQYKKFQQAQQAVKEGNLVSLQNLFTKSSKFLKSKTPMLLNNACSYGNKDAFLFLVHQAQKQKLTFDPRLLVAASYGGSVPLTSHLLPLLNIPLHEQDPLYQEALISASTQGHEKMVKFLKPYVQDKKVLGDALSWACLNGQERVVKILLSKETASHDTFRPLQWAIKGKHEHIIVLLMPHSNLNQAVNAGRKKFAMPDNIVQEVKVMVERSQLHQKLSHAVKKKNKVPPPSRKM